ncbi:PH domain-containing protein [Mucilaginibacter sp.]
MVQTNTLWLLKPYLYPFMKDVYKSAVGSAIYIPMCIVGGLFISVLISRAWSGVIMLGVVFIFILHLFFNTYYTISGNELKIKCGFIINKTIDISTIKKIEPSRNMLSSPALSMDRLEIFYNQYDSVLISPEDKAGFIERLKGINNNIVTN